MSARDIKVRASGNAGAAKKARARRAEQGISGDTPAPPLSAVELALVLAAERLFAEHGIPGVSLRQVVAAAGQKNLSAAHYHFGSREGLLLALMTLRMTQINRRRAQLLASPSTASPAISSDTAGASDDLRFYVEAYVAPLADQLKPRESGNFCLRFLEQYRHIPRDQEILLALQPAAFVMDAQIRRLLAYLPAPIANARIENSYSMIVAVLAAIEYDMRDKPLSEGELAFLKANLVDSMVSALSAPVSFDTMSHLASGNPAGI